MQAAGRSTHLASYTCKVSYLSLPNTTLDSALCNLRIAHARVRSHVASSGSSSRPSREGCRSGVLGRRGRRRAFPAKRGAAASESRSGLKGGTEGESRQAKEAPEGTCRNMRVPTARPSHSAPWRFADTNGPAASGQPHHRLLSARSAACVANAFARVVLSQGRRRPAPAFVRACSPKKNGVLHRNLQRSSRDEEAEGKRADDDDLPPKRGLSQPLLSFSLRGRWRGRQSRSSLESSVSSSRDLDWGSRFEGASY